MGRRLFTAEFKRECAKLVLKQNYIINMRQSCLLMSSFIEVPVICILAILLDYERN